MVTLQLNKVTRNFRQMVKITTHRIIGSNNNMIPKNKLIFDKTSSMELIMLLNIMLFLHNHKHDTTPIQIKLSLELFTFLLKANQKF